MKEEVFALKRDTTAYGQNQVKVLRETEKLKAENEKSQQQDNSRNVEIFGLKKSVNVNLVETIKKIATKIGLEDFDMSEIDEARRVPTRPKREKDGTMLQKPALESIVLRFKSANGRGRWLQQRYKLKSNEVFADGDESMIYINEHLTSEQKKLLWMAKDRARTVGWKFLWTRNGKILCRKTDGQPPVMVDAESDLAKLN